MAKFGAVRKQRKLMLRVYLDPDHPADQEFLCALRERQHVEEQAESTAMLHYLYKGLAAEKREKVLASADANMRAMLDSPMAVRSKRIRSSTPKGPRRDAAAAHVKAPKHSIEGPAITPAPVIVAARQAPAVEQPLVPVERALMVEAAPVVRPATVIGSAPAEVVAPCAEPAPEFAPTIIAAGSEQSIASAPVSAQSLEAAAPKPGRSRLLSLGRVGSLMVPPEATSPNAAAVAPKSMPAGALASSIAEKFKSKGESLERR